MFQDIDTSHQEVEVMDISIEAGTREKHTRTHKAAYSTYGTIINPEKRVPPSCCVLPAEMYICIVYIYKTTRVC